MNILESKTIIIDNINSIFIEYQKKMDEYDRKEKEWVKEKCIMNEMNHKLIHEISEKDKLLCLNDKKLLDYETMINQIQDEALKEMDEKTKHDMLRAQDKEIYERDKEIKRLQKKIETLEEEKRVVTETVKEVVEDVEELKGDINNKEAGEEEEDTQSLIPSQKSPTLVEKMMEVSAQNVTEDVKENVTEDVKEDVTEDVSGETTEDMTDEESDDGVVVETIKHYGKEYFIIEGEKPQYIYAIEDGDLGDKKGELINGKKKMYKK